MYQRFKVSNAGSHRKTDENGYLFVDQSPILKAGILEYYGSELIDGGDDDTIKGRKIDPKKIYRVYIPRDELIKGADSFKLLPITNEHQWLGREGADAREYQEGTSGDTVTVKGDMLYVPLKFTGDEIIEDLESGDKEELSASYTNELSWADNPDYDFVASDIKGNHIALVEKGRCGSDVRVLNQAMEFKHMKKTKVSNELKLIIDGKEVDLEQFFKQEAKEDAHADTDAIKDAENEEVVDTEREDEIVTDNEDTDKRALIDEIGGILKDKGLDEEIIRTVIGKAEKLAYDGSEASESDNELPEDDKNEPLVELDDIGDDDEKLDNGCKSKNEDEIDPDDKEDDKVSLSAKVANAIAKRESNARRAYNMAAEAMGEFNPFGMTEREMLVKALNHKGVSDVAKASTRELYAMLKVANQMGSVDSAFAYDSGAGSDSVEINI